MAADFDRLAKETLGFRSLPARPLNPREVDPGINPRDAVHAAATAVRFDDLAKHRLRILEAAVLAAIGSQVVQRAQCQVMVLPKHPRGGLQQVEQLRFQPLVLLL